VKAMKGTSMGNLSGEYIRQLFPVAGLFFTGIHFVDFNLDYSSEN